MWKLIALICLYVAPDVCGSLPEPEFEKADSTYLRLGEGSFTGIEPFIETRDYFCARQESVIWTDRARWAHIVLSTYEAGCTLNGYAKNEDEEIGRFSRLAEEPLDLDDVFTVDAPHGDFRVRQFQQAQRYCFFFYNGLFDGPLPGEDGIVRRVVGYACGYPRVFYTRDDIRHFVRSIAVGDKPDSGVVAAASQTIFQSRSNGPYVDWKYPLQGRWVGVDEQLTGAFDYMEEAPTGAFELNLPGESSPCYGQWRRQTAGTSAMKAATWAIRCRGLPVPSGDFYFTGVHSGEMTGLDEKGGLLKLRFGTPDKEEAESRDEEHRVPITWDGIASEKRVIVILSTSGWGGGLSFHDETGAIECDGMWFRNGDWTAQCTYGRTVSGQSLMLMEDSILGSGSDDLGRVFRFGSG